MHSPNYLLPFLLAGLLTGIGCTAGVRRAELSASAAQAALDRARADGAETWAAPELRQATKSLGASRRAAKEGAWERAGGLADDAELAAWRAGVQARMARAVARRRALNHRLDSLRAVLHGDGG
jgi:hypothetical protein